VGGSASGSGVEDEELDGKTGTPRTKRGILEIPAGLLKTDANKGKSENVRSPPRRKPKKNTSTSTQSNHGKKALVVIDGPNVAMKHGKKSYFSVVGLKIAIEYYISRGYDAIAFVPEYIATRKAQPSTLGGSTLRLGDFMTVGDNLPQLMELVEQGRVVLTPAQDYDDSYCIEYAKNHNGFIVTNDRYNDHIEKQPSEREKAVDRKFIRDHSISFTFIRDEFMPNPDFVLPQ